MAQIRALSRDSAVFKAQTVSVPGQLYGGNHTKGTNLPYL